MNPPIIDENFNKKTILRSRIFCYTGTGNCFAAAKQISQYFGGLPIDFITEKLCCDTKNSNEIELDFAVIVLPSYGFGLPKLVKRFLKNNEFNIGYLAIAVLQGSSQRGTAAEAVKILCKKGQKVHYSSAVDSVENYVHLFGHPRPEVQKQRSDIQEDNIESLCKVYENRTENKIKLFRPLSALVSLIFKIGAFIFAKCYKVTPNCNSCEICRKVCPPNAIIMQQKKGKSIPKFKSTKCDHCQACLQLCPKKAIQFFRIRPKSPRYIHRNVTLSELIKRD
ncbi:MAG: EFR1 family ferrodoxin [Firmicutes bacterium]|nr:EFR1 family ferrodoxin [Bacillota bacterium]